MPSTRLNTGDSEMSYKSATFLTREGDKQMNTTQWTFNLGHAKGLDNSRCLINISEVNDK